MGDFIKLHSMRMRPLLRLILVVVFIFCCQQTVIDAKHYLVKVKEAKNTKGNQKYEAVDEDKQRDYFTNVLEQSVDPKRKHGLYDDYNLESIDVREEMKHMLKDL